ncbi:MAG TPA: hypothetical protein DCR17_15835, partial [Verrucomicrobiales bacterium]|nr:hypothetical protein [Verrucomicrobiales bacterium]
SIPKESVPDEGITKLNLNDASSSGQPDSTTGSAPQKKLSKEEQMAKFEEAMKNEDWGHQPC